MTNDYKKTISRLSLKSVELVKGTDGTEMLKAPVKLGWDDVSNLYVYMDDNQSLQLRSVGVVDSTLDEEVSTALREEKGDSQFSFFKEELTQLFAEAKLEQKLSVPKDHLKLFLKNLDEKDSDTKYQYASALFVFEDGTGKIKTFKTPIETRDSDFIEKVKGSVLALDTNADKVFLLYYASERKLEHKLL